MRLVRWASWMGVVALAATFGSAQPAGADVASDRAAAIVLYPLVASFEGFGDTVIQLSNTSRDAPIDVHCFYLNANPHCSNTGEVCFSPEECCDGTNGCGLCLPGWNETDFHIRLTPLQPIAWLANEGLEGEDFPLDGVTRLGPDGSSNAGSNIPPVPENPFIGELKCIAVSPEGFPIDRNVLKGEATLEQFIVAGDIVDEDEDVLDVAKYNAVGIQAIEGAVNDDNTLVLGGDGAEYNGCPNVTIVNHFSDFVRDPATDDECEIELAGEEEGGDPAEQEGCIATRLILVPCSQDLLRQVPGSAVVQYLVYNEFEQRFSTSRALQCQQALLLSQIDTTQPHRSIFSAAVLGTVTAQTRLTPIGSGLVGVAIESHDSEEIEPEDEGPIVRTDSAAFNLHFQGDRPDSDLIILP